MLRQTISLIVANQWPYGIDSTSEMPTILNLLGKSERDKEIVLLASNTDASIGQHNCNWMPDNYSTSDLINSASLLPAFFLVKLIRSFQYFKCKSNSDR